MLLPDSGYIDPMTTVAQLYFLPGAGSFAPHLLLETGDLETVELRDGYEQYDFKIPFIVREAEEEMLEPSLDPLTLPASKYPFDLLKKAVGRGIGSCRRTRRPARNTATIASIVAS